MLPGALAVAQPLTDPQSEYSKAVKSYVDAATDHLKSVRNLVETRLKDASGETKERFRKTNDAIEETDRLLSQLKNAAPRDFDRIKAEFEKSRDRMVKELEAAQKS